MMEVLITILVVRCCCMLLFSQMHVVNHADGSTLTDSLGKAGGVAVLAFYFQVSLSH